MIEIKSLTIDELKSALKEMGEKPFRAGSSPNTNSKVSEEE